MRIKNFNDPLEELKYFKRLWRASVPPHIEVPPDQTFMLWITTVSRRGLQHSIIKTGRRMMSNLNQGLTLVEHAAPKYCSSLVAQWRSSQDREILGTERGVLEEFVLEATRSLGGGIMKKTEQQEQQMVWCHIYPLIETNSGDGVQQLEVNASLTVVVYRDYEDAVEAQRISGGLLMKIPSSSLKGQVEAGCMQTVQSAHKELMEIEEQPSWCHLAVGKSLPFTEVHDPEGNLTAWQFSPEAGDWLSTFVEQSGIEVSL